MGDIIVCDFVFVPNGAPWPHDGVRRMVEPRVAGPTEVLRLGSDLALPTQMPARNGNAGPRFGMGAK